MAKKRKFVVISGSSRFIKQWKEAWWQVVSVGNVPYAIAGDGKADPGHIKRKPALDELYQYVIKQYADELFVINVGGYIGDSTRNEMIVAGEKGIPIRFLEPPGGKSE